MWPQLIASGTEGHPVVAGCNLPACQMEQRTKVRVFAGRLEVSVFSLPFLTAVLASSLQDHLNYARSEANLPLTGVLKRIQTKLLVKLAEEFLQYHSNLVPFLVYCVDAFMF